jgi:ribosomal protein S18 acetylase RimI-like enzyme
MSLIFQKSDFDTGLLWVNTYKLFLDIGVSEDDIWKALKECETWDIVFSFLPFDHHCIQMMEEYNFSFQSIRSYYKLWSFDIQWAEGSDIFFIDADISEKFSRENILFLSNTLWETSRYFHDENISRDKAETLYFTWVDNVLSRKYGDGGFVAVENGWVLWVVNVMIKWDIWYIDLLWVIPSAQWKWYGKQLLFRGIKFLKEKWVKDIMVITEWENILANRFYQKNNFTLDKIELVYHKCISSKK